MKTRDHSMEIRSVFLFLAISLLLAASLACGFGAGEPTPTMTPAPPTPVPPTATPTPIPPTPTPALIPGIDEPIVLENILVKDVLGTTWHTDIHLRVLNAYTKGSLDSESGSKFPNNSDHVFLILDLELSGQSGSLEWAASNASLTCGIDRHNVDRWGIDVGEDGKLKAWLFIFEVPQDLDFEKCVFQLKEYAIELADFFE
jgi:hypothetical protein